VSLPAFGVVQRTSKEAAFSFAAYAVYTHLNGHRRGENPPDAESPEAPAEFADQGADGCDGGRNAGTMPRMAGPSPLILRPFRKNCAVLSFWDVDQAGAIPSAVSGEAASKARQRKRPGRPETARILCFPSPAGVREWKPSRPRIYRSNAKLFRI
jgi:hypothetical protein